MIYNTIILSFGLLIVIVLLATLAARIQVPYAVVLVIGGTILGFVPGLPRIVLNPDLVLLLFLPPLIYSAAWQTSWHSFKRSLLLLAGLVCEVVSRWLQPLPS